MVVEVLGCARAQTSLLNESPQEVGLTGMPHSNQAAGSDCAPMRSSVRMGRLASPAGLPEIYLEVRARRRLPTGNVPDTQPYLIEKNLPIHAFCPSCD